MLVAYILRLNPSPEPILMLDAVTLDQLRTFIAAAETGSFSAAGRKIDGEKSVVSQSLANLELQLSCELI